MNSKYQQLMDKVMEKIEDLSKRLSRPVKDLDDVRQAMATLKEVREDEIYIDFTLGPVEVSEGSTFMTIALGVLCVFVLPSHSAAALGVIRDASQVPDPCGPRRGREGRHLQVLLAEAAHPHCEFAWYHLFCAWTYSSCIGKCDSSADAAINPSTPPSLSPLFFADGGAEPLDQNPARVQEQPPHQFSDVQD